MCRRSLALAIAFLPACSSGPTGSIQLIFSPAADGGTSNPLTDSPPATKLAVQVYDPDGGRGTIATTSFPASSIDLGNVDGNSVEAFAVTASDADGARVAFGGTLPVQLGALDGVSLPIFVQRTGRMAPLPGALPDSRTSPLLAVLDGRYLVVAGSDTSTVLYDFVAYASASGPSLPIVPQSMALPACTATVTGSVCFVAWLIGKDGSGAYAGYYYDLSSGTSTAFVLPPGGGSFPDIAGGVTAFSAQGTMFIVGGTGIGQSSKWVLAIDSNNTSDSAYPNGYPSWLTLAHERVGAAPLWVNGYGLVVIGGSSTAPGVEVVAGPALSCTSDALDVAGAGACALPDGHSVLIAGGVIAGGLDAGVGAFDLATCTMTRWASLPVALANAAVFDVDQTNAIVVGNEASTGTPHVFRVDPTGAVEIALTGSHSGVSAWASPVATMNPGSFVALGGGSAIESFMP